MVAVGARTSLAALVAAGLESQSIASLHLFDCYESLKQVFEQKVGVNQAPELFCFGLLEQFDIDQLKGLIGPRKIRLEIR